MHRFRWIPIALLLASPLCAKEGQVDFEKLLETHSASIVTIRAVLKVDVNMGGQAQSQESRIEVQGTIVDPSGLVMVSKSYFSSEDMKEALAMRGGRGAGVDIDVTPSEIKVIFEREEKEYDAFLAATDAKLELAFVQVVDLGDRKLSAISLESGGKLSIGELVVGISRLQRGYDFAPIIESARVSGHIAKPRKATILDGGLVGVGLPAFNARGQFVGVVGPVQVTADEEAEGASAMRMLRMLMGRGGQRASTPTFVLPPDTVRGSADLAKKEAEKLLAERAEKKASGNDEAEEEGDKKGKDEKKESGEDEEEDEDE